MRHLLLIASLFILTSCTGCFAWAKPAPISEPPEVTVPERYHTALDGVLALTTEGGQVYCSAAWVDPSHAVTAAHCVEGEEQVLVGIYRFYDAPNDLFTQRFPMTVVRSNDVSDAALLRWAGSTIPPSHTVFPLLEGETYVGEPIHAFGHARGSGFFFTEGRVVQPLRTLAAGGLNNIWTQHNAFTIPGMSGGPVVNYAGELVGLNSFTNFTWPVMSGAVHIRSLREIMGE